MGWTTVTKLVGSTIGAAEENTIPYDWARDGPWYGLFTFLQYLTNPIAFIPPCHLIFQVSYIWSSVYLFPLLCVDKVERATHFFLAIFNYYNALNTVLRFVLTVHYYFTVLPSFSGNVPAVFSKLFPSANITRLGDW